MSKPTVRDFRLAVYALMIVTAAGGMLGRVWSVRSELGKTPLLSANDRSRWCTIRALVDHGTYAIDDVIFLDREGTRRDREWYTIDMVRHRAPDGREHYFSSKPPLLATMLAGLYWVIQSMTGTTLKDHPFYVARILLVVANVIPLTLSLWLLSQFAERYGTRSWSRAFVVAAACYGTFLTTFAVTLNNHVFAAVSVLLTVYFALPVWENASRSLYRFVFAGLFSAFAVANELPALAFFVAIAVAMLLRSPGRTLAGFAPAAALVAACYFGTNLAAHDSWRPPYAHRSDGPLVAEIQGDHTASLAAGVIPAPLGDALLAVDRPLSPEATIGPRVTTGGWILWDPAHQRRLAVTADRGALRVYRWDNWYDYEGSYWTSQRKSGVDQGEPSRTWYAFHALIGHHGILSLTPIWLLSIAGVWIWTTRGESRMRSFAALVAGLTLVCLAFYLARPLEDRNYGGVSCGFRWLFWLIPLWLIALLPACDKIAERPRWRWAAVALLLISAASSAFPSGNPWSHPWLYQYLDYVGRL